MFDFLPDLSVTCKPLHDRLKKNRSPWTKKHSKTVQFIKTQVKELPCILAYPTTFKIIKTDSFDIGYGGILKQRKK